MLPQGLVSTYQQYKQDTDEVAAWLASTALACGYAADLLNKVPLSFSGRLKGKERKDAKRARQKHGSQVNKENQPKHAIAIADFVALAEFIASSKSPSAPISHSFATALDRAISLRSSFGNRMAEEGVEKDPASDKKHVYFIDILKRVRTTLKPSMPPSQREDSPVRSAFSALKVYEPSETFLNAPGLSKSDQSEANTSNASYRAEQSAAFEEVVFAWTMMVNDLTQLRSRIKWIWSNHRDGTFDAATSALATNTAIDLARNIMEEVLPLTNGHGGCWQMAHAFHHYQCLTQGIPPVVASRDNFNYEAYDIANDTLVAVHRVLDAFLDVLDPKDLPIFREGCFGIYDPSSDRDTKNGEEKSREDKILLMQFFTEQMTVIRCVPDYPVEDEFLRGMKELDRTRQVPFYLAFAAQVHLDIHHVLRQHATGASESLLRTLELFHEDISGHLEFHKTLKSKNWPASNDETLRSLQREIRWVQSDPIYRNKVKQFQRSGVPCPPSLRPHLLLAWSPIVAGLMLFRFRAHLWNAGIAVNEAWGSILYSAQLYNALRNEGLLNVDHRWEDMDVVQSLFGHENFYVGDDPRARPEYLSKFCLSIGVSAAAFTQHNNGGGRKVALGSKAGPRSLKGDASVSKMFFARYLQHSGQLDWTPEHVDGIIARSRFKEQSSKESSRVFVKSTYPQKARHPEAAKSGPLSSSELIRSLTLSLQAESLELSFLYLMMHRECWRFLRVVKDACDPLLRELYTPNYLERES